MLLLGFKSNMTVKPMLILGTLSKENFGFPLDVSVSNRKSYAIGLHYL